MTSVKTADEIAAMRTGGKMLATVLDVLRQQIADGMTTKDLAVIAKQELRGLGGQPTILGYGGFPDVICISVNDEVVHGIPRQDVVLRNGDLVGLDFCVTYQGMVTDSAITVPVGGINSLPTKQRKLIQATERSLYAGIDVCHDGVRVGDISSAIEAVLSEGEYGIVRDLVGHGVGHDMHEDPNIPNYGRKGAGPMLRSGMTVAIEPMATLGGHRVITDADKWTIRTEDRSLAAHFEHTVLITDTGAEILTQL
ncbi:type I methionyl aminopeptidase [Candidatus Saccharibacteria bacterium]|nr:type I methionyl aminopeptidase [Candidatus Saccharibacteria bacterium]